jgi:hypothetical protein
MLAFLVARHVNARLGEAPVLVTSVQGTVPPTASQRGTGDDVPMKSLTGSSWSRSETAHGDIFKSGQQLMKNGRRLWNFNEELPAAVPAIRRGSLTDAPAGRMKKMPSTAAAYLPTSAGP